MSMKLDFEPHSWYMGAAIEHVKRDHEWYAYYEDGMVTYSVITFRDTTLAGVKQQVKRFVALRNERDAANRAMLD